MIRQFIPVMFTWRDATGREAQTRLYWAGPVFNTPDGANGLLGDPDSQPDRFSALPWLIDPRQNDGVTGYLQACSSAALVDVQGPVPERWLHDVYHYNQERYGTGGVPYGSVEDVLEVELFTTFNRPPLTGGPPPAWRFSLPAPVPENFTPGHRNPDPDAGVPIWNALSVFTSFCVEGSRWTDPEMAHTGAWCSDTGVYVENVSSVSRRVRRYSRLIRDQYRAPSLALPAL